MHIKKEQLKNALPFLYKQLNIVSEIGDKVSTGAVFHRMGGVYYTMGNFQKALKLYKKCLGIVEAIGDTSGKDLVESDIKDAEAKLQYQTCTIWTHLNRKQSYANQLCIYYVKLLLLIY